MKTVKHDVVRNCCHIHDGFAGVIHVTYTLPARFKTQTVLEFTLSSGFHVGCCSCKRDGILLEGNGRGVYCLDCREAVGKAFGCSR